MIKARLIGKTPVDFVIASAKNLPFKNDCFDHLFCGCVLHHLPKDLRLLAKQFYEVLKQGGDIFIFEPNALTPASIYHYYLAIKGSLNERALLAFKVKKILQNFGFSIIRCLYIKKVQLKKPKRINESALINVINKCWSLLHNLFVDRFKIRFLSLYFAIYAKK